MELASFLSGDEWTDRPACTNPLLATAAQYVNDDLRDEERYRLLPLLGRLMNTSLDGPEIEDAVHLAAADYVRPFIGHPDRMVHSLAQEAQAAYAKPKWVVGNAEIAVHVAGGDTVDLLSTLIDAYDKVTGRTEAATVTEDDLRRCAELTGATA